jgi:hypothetical protein
MTAAAASRSCPTPTTDSGYYGISAIDRPHILISQMSYGRRSCGRRRRAARCVRRLEPGRVFQAQSGTPFDVTTTVTVAGVGAGSGPQYYNIVGDPNTGRSDFNGTSAVWFNKDAFKIRRRHLRDGLERNLLRQPGFWDLHMSLRKSDASGPPQAPQPSRGAAVGRVQRAEPPDARQRADESDARRLRHDHVEDRQPHDADRLQYVF